MFEKIPVQGNSEKEEIVLPEEKVIFNEKDVQEFFDTLKDGLPEELRGKNADEILKSQAGWRMVGEIFISNNFPEKYNTDYLYDNDVDEFGDFKAVLISQMFENNPKRAAEFFGEYLIKLYKERRKEWLDRAMWANLSDYEPDDYTEEERQRLEYCRSIHQPDQDDLEERGEKEPENLERDAILEMMDYHEIFGRTTSEILKNFKKHKEKIGDWKTDFYLLNYIDRDFYSRYHAREIAECLKGRKEISPDFDVALFDYLRFGPIEKAKVIMFVLTEAYGAEIVRKKINERIEGSSDMNEEYAYARSLITPNHDKIAISNLQKFYEENIKFEEYKVNERMNEKEVELLESLIRKDEKALEMGCGAGRLITELAKDGYDISGYDFTQRHVEKTKEAIEKTGHVAKVFQGDWHNNAIQNESMNTVYSLGRNILHDYSIIDQVQLFREANRILASGGQFIFDIPNREKGGYKKMVEEYASEMKKRGIRNFRYGSIYDSPDGQHFATRYAYSHEDIEELAKLTGFKIKKIEKLPLKTGEGDENLYYVLEKI
ncbi:MAG TPA: class I SAM-dependent methyltransferase [Candidatus Moranbacteria bacterium]|nr:class I SAM-dependent methyltransferase [Candidatus Moranbacteria bacterium]